MTVRIAVGVAADAPFTPRHVAAVVALVALTLLVAIPLVIADRVRDVFRDIDTSAPCVPESSICLSRETGAVAKPPTDGRLSVRYDDGRRELSVYLADEDWRPTAGTRVVLERWRGDVVSLYEPDSRRRHKTAHWPYVSERVVDVLDWVVVLGVVSFVCATALIGSLAWRAGRARR